MSIVSDLADQMAAAAVSAKKTTGSTSGLSGNNKTLADNYQTFLTLLTTQLKHQDPTAPMDTNQFMQQLTQFSGIEQQLKSNDYLKNISTGMGASSNTNIVSYLGKYVTAKGSESTTNSTGKVPWRLTVPTETTDATLTIRDSAGAIVATKKNSFEQGTYDFVWDGRMTNGGQAPVGNYTLSIDAKDVNGNALSIDTSVTGMVSEVDLSGAEPMIVVNGSKIKASAVQDIRLTS